VTPPPLWAPGWNEVTVRTLCLEVEQSYPEIPHKDPEPIAQATRKVLSGLGLHVVAAGDPCDATLTIAVTGQARAGDYLLEGYCYTGARVEGRADLSVPGRAPLIVPLAGLQMPPPRIQHCPRDPTDAPFEAVWLEVLLGTLFDLWGPQVLVQALGDERVLTRSLAASVLIEVGPEASEAVPALIQALEDSDENVRASAAQALREMGPQAIDAVPALIQALGDPHPQVWQSAVIALRHITGRDFAEDAAAWQEWWEKGRPGTPVPSATAPPTPACTRDAAFEADVTIPDDTTIQAGGPFVKTWRIRNTGTCDWNVSYHLAFVDGDRMGGPNRAAVPQTSAGESAAISVGLVAPPEKGRYRGYWQMCVGEAACFGDRVYVQIISTE
jgi:hypothetical protein